MTIEHKNLTDPNIHEPKGVNSAVINTVYKADGAGSGASSKLPVQSLGGLSGVGLNNQTVQVDGTGNFKLVNPLSYGGIYFVNVGAPLVITYPSIYTKVTPVTLASGITPVDFTESNNGRLTYTGSATKVVEVKASLSLSQSTGASRDIKLALYKNGSIIASSEQVITTTTTEKANMSITAHTSMVTNDYVEVFIINQGASGDVSVQTYRLEAKADL